MNILYQDDRIVVAVKPVGVLSTDEPGGMPELLRAQLHTDCIRTVHRLDAQVSGVMVFARSRMAAALLSQQIRERRFTKEYLAVLCGTPSQPSGVLTDLLARDPQRRLTYVADTPSQRAGGPPVLRHCGQLRRYDAGARPAPHRPYPPDTGTVRLPRSASGR